METVKKFTYFGDRVSACVRCEVAVTLDQDFGWLRLGKVGVTVWKHVSFKAERGCLQMLYKASNSVLE